MDPDLAIYFAADPDPASQNDAVPDPSSHNDKDQDPASQYDADLCESGSATQQRQAHQFLITSL